ncbi:phage integrase SAM-like domain-containing protein [Flavobacterium sp. LB2P74]|uniref:phage integrase SAM-like domain-containing protein n=1 Tax=Flavobacterium sp. LB2P74 TaxID=3401717 RepID=UPI003AAC6B46
MATVQFRLRSKANKNVSIKVRLSIDRENVFELNTPFSINPKDWSKVNQRPIPSSTKKRPTGNDELAKEFDKHQKFKQTLHENLGKLESYITREQNKDLANSILIDSNWLESKINDCFDIVVKTDTCILMNHTQSIIDNANTRKIRTNGGYKIGLSKSTIKNYTLFRNIIKEYQIFIKKQIRFTEISKPFTDKFTNWLINTKGYGNNYAGKQLEILKTVCIDAEKHEIKINPYSKVIQHFRESDKDRYIQTLSFEELEQIKNTYFTDIEQLKEFKAVNPQLTKNLLLTPETLNNARNWILIGCEIGQRGGDLIKIKDENIRRTAKGIYIDIIQQKTNKSVTIGVIAPHVIEIIENNLPKEIPHQKLNEYSKVICKMAGIVEVVKGTKLNTETNRKEIGKYPKYKLIASHCFRRSFSSNYYKIIPTAILIGITGHSKESLFLTYINKREDKDANADLFMKFYEDLHKNKKPEMKVIKSGTNN